MTRQVYTTTQLVLLISALTTAYKLFQTRIPNGERVPNPCDNKTWQGVGHINKAGGGDRNPFGQVS